MRVITAMVRRFDLEAGPQHLAEHLGQQAVVAGEVDALGAGTGDELLGHSHIADASPATNEAPMSVKVRFRRCWHTSDGPLG